MAETTIEWTRGPNGEQGFTFNPWIGCTKISPACDNCYAAAQDKFRHWTAEGWGGPRKRTSIANWRGPVKWNADAAHAGVRYRVFCASLADVFDNQVPPEWRADLFELIEATPHLDWLLLTKRIGNTAGMLPALWTRGHGVPPNIWIGATIANQEEADRDIPKLLAVPARVRFLSMEPLLGPVTLNPRHFQRHPDKQKGTDWDYEGINWVIAGGESGPGARPMHPEWARSLRDQCASAGVPFLHKQWGEWLPISQQNEEFTNRLYKSRRMAKLHEDQSALDDSYGRRSLVPTTVVHADGSTHDPVEPMAFLHGTNAMLTFKVGKKAAGRLLDGRTWDGFPS